MALRNLARMTSATSGTGTLTLGSAVSGFLSFANAGISDGEVVTYAIRDGSASEIGRGIYTSSGTTLTRDIVYESTNSGNKISCSGSEEVFITPAAENLNAYGLLFRLTGGHTDDDDFSSDTSGSYTTITPTGTATWAVANHVATCTFTGQTANDICCFVKAMTLSDGQWWETSIRMITGVPTSTRFSMAGLVVTDGTTTTSNALAAIYYVSNAGAVAVDLWKGTVTNMATNINTFTLSNTMHPETLRMRLTRTTSTSWNWSIGNLDGAQVSAFGTTGGDPGFTPTHAGLFVSSWGGTQTAIASFDYIRHMA